ncbi:sugar MFS transporter [Chloroflexota bacterium]
MPIDLRSKHMQLLVLSYAAFIALSIPGGAFGVAWLYIQDSFGVTLGALGVLMAIMSVPRLLVSFFSGAIIARLSIGRFMLGGMVLIMVGTSAYVFVTEWWLFVVVSVIASIGSSAIINGLNTFIAANYTPRQMNWLHACFGLGATIGPLLLTFIVLAMGQSWRVFYLLMLILQVGIGLLIFATRRDWQLGAVPDEKGQDIHVQADRPETQVSLLDTLRLPLVWISVTLFFVATGAEINSGQLTTILFVEGRGIDPGVAGRWLSVYWASLTVGRLVAGAIINKFDPARYLRVNMLWTIVGALLLWAHLSDLSSFIGLALMGFTLGPFAPTMYSDTPRLVGLPHATNAIGFQNAGAGLGLALPPLLATILAERIGLETIGPVLLGLAVVTFVLHEILTLVSNRQPATQPVPVKRTA